MSDIGKILIVTGYFVVLLNCAVKYSRQDMCVVRRKCEYAINVHLGFTGIWTYTMSQGVPIIQQKDSFNLFFHLKERHSLREYYQTNKVVSFFVCHLRSH